MSDCVEQERAVCRGEGCPCPPVQHQRPATKRAARRVVWVAGAVGSRSADRLHPAGGEAVESVRNTLMSMLHLSYRSTQGGTLANGQGIYAIGTLCPVRGYPGSLAPSLSADRPLTGTL
jgi:hypothetical protein